MSTRSPIPALETVTVPRVEMDAHKALMALVDRALSLMMHDGPRTALHLLDLDRAVIHARAAICNEIDSRMARGLPLAETRRPVRRGAPPAPPSRMAT